MIYVNDLKSYAAAVDRVAQSPRCAFDTETYTIPQYNTQQYKASDLRTNPHTGAVSLLTVMTDPSVGGETYVFDFICLQNLGYAPTLLASALAANQYAVAQMGLLSSN